MLSNEFDCKAEFITLFAGSELCLRDLCTLAWTTELKVMAPCRVYSKQVRTLHVLSRTVVEVHAIQANLLVSNMGPNMGRQVTVGYLSGSKKMSLIVAVSPASVRVPDVCQRTRGPSA